MLSEKRKLRFALILSMLMLSACDKAPETHPHFIDVGLNECAEHAILDPANMTISDQPSKIWPIEHCDGYFAIPITEAKAWKDYLLQKNKDCGGK